MVQLSDYLPFLAATGQGGIAQFQENVGQQVFFNASAHPAVGRGLPNFKTTCTRDYVLKSFPRARAANGTEDDAARSKGRALWEQVLPGTQLLEDSIDVTPVYGKGWADHKTFMIGERFEKLDYCDVKFRFKMHGNDDIVGPGSQASFDSILVQG